MYTLWTYFILSQFIKDSAASWNAFKFQWEWEAWKEKDDQSVSLNFLVRVVYKVKIFKIFLQFFDFTLLPGLLENEKSWKKRVSECNSDAMNYRLWKFSPFWS